MRIAVGGGLLAVVALGIAGVVLAQKGMLPLPSGLAGVGAAPAPLAVPAPMVKAPANPVSTLGLAPSQMNSVDGLGQGPTTAPQGSAAPAPVVLAAATAAAPPPEPSVPLAPLPKCDNPNALGVARIVQIDTTGGPGFGFEHFKTHDFLRPKEVVLTFDDGPWPGNTPAVLAALAAECVKATFFAIGKHATWHPEILKQVAEQGHTVGTHTWSHKDLSTLTLDQAKEEIEKGVSAVHWALGAPSASFVRFPALRHPPEAVAYVGERNMAVFSADIDSLDFKIKKPEQVIKSVMKKLEKNGKGIILMHDFQRATAHAMPELLRQLKANGYKIVHMTSKAPLSTLEAYDAEVMKELGGTGMTGASAQPTKDVVQTISGD
ncbi:MAG: polysaccharide deacetylase family protein [Xanthobacteraceae bacterium]